MGQVHAGVLDVPTQGWRRLGQDVPEPVVGDLVAHPGRVDRLILVGSGGPTLEFTEWFGDNIETRLRPEDVEARRYWRLAAKNGVDRDKAGAYGIQEKQGVIVESISGSFSNVAGLPFLPTDFLLDNPDAGTDTVAAQVDLQGNLDFSSIKLNGLTVGVTGANYVVDGGLIKTT